MIDARISVGLPAHPKTKKLIRRLGDGGAWRLVCLFLWVASNKPDGNLVGMSGEDIELAADWMGEEGAFIGALKQVGFIDGEEGVYRIHDWSEHNPWAAGSDARAEKSRWLALCKHHGRKKAAEMMPEYAAKIGASAGGSDDAGCSPSDRMLPDASSTAAAENSSAPSPLPSPLPSPIPSSVVDVSTAVAPDELQPAALPAGRLPVVEPEQTRRGTVCRLLRAAGISDAAPHHLTDDTWAQILAKRTDEEIVEFARAKQAARPGQRTGLKYLAPGLLEDPTPIAVPTTGARASPRGMTREQGRAIAASTRLSDFRAACAAEQGLNDELTIEAPAAPRQLG